MTNSDHISIERPAVLGEFRSYRRKYDATLVDYSNLSSINEVAQVIRSHIVTGIPFSMARLGDGEGACLFYGEPEFDSLRTFCISRTLALHFGSGCYSSLDYEFFFRQTEMAARNAKLITFARRKDVHDGLVAAETNDIRGYVGATFADIFVGALPRTKERIFYEEGYLHVKLLPHYPHILSEVDLVIISSTSEEFNRKLANLFHARLVASISIPDQSLNVGRKLDAYLYPDFIDEVRTRVAALAGPGKVFLIAAGLAAKLLCNDVQRLGGVAIDVGSVMDVWSGRGVRGYQDPVFVERHRLNL